MRNAMILVGLWLGIVLASYGLVYLESDGPRPAQLAYLERIAARVTSDPMGRFQFERPPGWRVETLDLGIHAIGPVEMMEVWILAIDEMVPARAIAVGWESVNACFGCAVKATELIFSPEPGKREAIIEYATEDDGLVTYGLARSSIGGSLVLLVRADLATYTLRERDIALIRETLRPLLPAE